MILRWDGYRELGRLFGCGGLPMTASEWAIDHEGNAVFGRVLRDSLYSRYRK
jgi:hypothetical protein